MRGELPGKHPLTERLASEFLGISRTPVRAALQTLANEGLLTYEPQKGYSAHTLSRQSVSDAYKVRAVLEALACKELAASGVSPQTREVLNSCIETGQALLADKDRFNHAEWRVMNALLHKTIAEATGNEALLSALRQVENRPLASSNVIATIGADPDFHLLEMSQTDHEYIVSYIISGQAERAAARMNEHLMIGHDLIIKGMETGQS